MTRPDARVRCRVDRERLAEPLRRVQAVQRQPVRRRAVEQPRRGVAAARGDADVRGRRARAGGGGARGRRWRATRRRRRQRRPEPVRAHHVGEFLRLRLRGLRARAHGVFLFREPVHLFHVLARELGHALGRFQAHVDLAVFQVLDVISERLVLLPRLQRAFELSDDLLVRGFVRDRVHEEVRLLGHERVAQARGPVGDVPRRRRAVRDFAAGERGVQQRVRAAAGGRRDYVRGAGQHVQRRPRRALRRRRRGRVDGGHRLYPAHGRAHQIARRVR